MRSRRDFAIPRTIATGKAQSLVVTYFEIGVIRDQQSSPSENAVCSIYRHTGVAALRRFDAH
jgi:hypothetical protein